MSETYSPRNLRVFYETAEKRERIVAKNEDLKIMIKKKKKMIMKHTGGLERWTDRNFRALATPPTLRARRPYIYKYIYGPRRTFRQRAKLLVIALAHRFITFPTPRPSSLRKASPDDPPLYLRSSGLLSFQREQRERAKTPLRETRFARLICIHTCINKKKIDK